MGKLLPALPACSPSTLFKCCTPSTKSGALPHSLHVLLIQSTRCPNHSLCKLSPAAGDYKYNHDCLKVEAACSCLTSSVNTGKKATTHGLRFTFLSANSTPGKQLNKSAPFHRRFLYPNGRLPPILGRQVFVGLAAEGS